jgi:ring-1,2-phenylacetyl-CoA epoxidase subunit PaaC
LETLWPFTGELFSAAPFEQALSESLKLDMDGLKGLWQQTLSPVFEEATIKMPKETGMQRGGKDGYHTEYMGYLLAEMQYLQRTHPNAVW